MLDVVVPFPLATVPALVLPVVSADAVIQEVGLWVVTVELIAWHAGPIHAAVDLNDQLHFGRNRCAAVFLRSTGSFTGADASLR